LITNNYNGIRNIMINTAEGVPKEPRVEVLTENTCDELYWRLLGLYNTLPANEHPDFDVINDGRSVSVAYHNSPSSSDPLGMEITPASDDPQVIEIMRRTAHLTEEGHKIVTTSSVLDRRAGTLRILDSSEQDATHTFSGTQLSPPRPHGAEIEESSVLMRGIIGIQESHEKTASSQPSRLSKVRRLSRFIIHGSTRHS
jgi:hypothetical protein